MAKKLVLYFSVYGTAKAVAEEIARQTGADLMEIEPVVPYDSDRNHYNALAKLAKKEHDEDQRPAIKNTIPVGEYDTIYLGYPMWWYTFPMIIYTLFDQGSGDGGTYATIRKLAPNATVLIGLPVEMKQAERGDAHRIEKWLKDIGQN